MILHPSKSFATKLHSIYLIYIKFCIYSLHVQRMVTMMINKCLFMFMRGYNMHKSAIYSTYSTLEWLCSNWKLFTCSLPILFGHWEFHPSTQQAQIDCISHSMETTTCCCLANIKLKLIADTSLVAALSIKLYSNQHL